MWQVWLIICGVCLVLEMITHGFLIFWFAIGAIFTMITSFFTDDIVIQTTIFILSSTALLFATKPLIKKFINKEKDVQTNAFSAVGKIAIVTEEINIRKEKGLVKLNGELWSALSNDESIIEKGSDVKVLEIQGVKLIVSQVNTTSTIN